MKEKNRINQTISSLIQNLNEIIDVNTVVGSPIKQDNEIIIPLAKITLFQLSGGGEYGKISIFSKNDEVPYSAGNGSVISINPCGFLVKNQNNDYKVLSVSNSNYDSLIDKATEFLKSITLNEKTTKDENND